MNPAFHLRFCVFFCLVWPLASTAAEGLPLKGERTVAFTTRTASWLSIDVHPDGTRLLMDVLGDLYTGSAEGGKTTRITSGMAFDSQPIWSPDGSSIAFISDRSGVENLWVANADGSEPSQITQEKGEVEFASPAFSPDGNHLIVSRTTWGLRTFELWAYPLEGGKGVQITTSKSNQATPIDERHNALGAVYSGDGRYVYYARRIGGFAYNLTLPIWQIARRDLQEGREDVLTQAPGSAMRPAISPDGKRLVYATRHRHETGLRIRNLDSGEDRWLIWPVEHDEQESRFTRDLMPAYDFSADGRFLFTSRAGQVHRIDAESGGSTPIPFEFAVEQELGTRLHFPWRIGVGPVKARVLMHPTLAPDGKRLAFSAFGELHMHDLVKNTGKVISAEGELAFQPTWSTDGRNIVYTTWDQSGGHLWKVPAGGGSPAQLTRHAAFYSDPVFSNDGRWIIALRGSGQERRVRENDFGQVGGADLVRLPANGGASTVIAPATGLTAPHFGPESDRVYLYASPGPFARTGSGSLISMRLDGTDRRTHLQVKGPGAYVAEEEIAPESAHIAPDGRHFLVHHANQLYVIQRLGNAYGDVVQSLTTPSLPQVRLTDVGADAAAWSLDGQSIYWTTGARWHSRDLGSIDYRDNKSPPAAKTTTESATPAAAEAEADKEAHTPAEAHASVRHLDIDIWKPRYVPEDSIALVNATMLTMEPDQPPMSDGVVIVTGDRINAVGSRDSLIIPKGTRQIDLEGRIVMPGFIDTHAHYRLLRGVFDRHNPSLLANLAYGVTTGIDVQPSTADILTYQDMVDAGLVTGPRTLSTGPGVFSNNAFKSATHAEHILRRYGDHYGVHNLKAYISGNRQQRQWLAAAAKKLKLMPTTEGGLDMKLNLTHVIDGFSGNEHNFPLLDLYDDVVHLVASSKIAYTPTLLVSYGGHWGEGWFFTRESPLDDPKLARFTPWTELMSRSLRRPWAHDREHVFTPLAAQARKIVAAGGLVGVGAHGQLQGLGFHWEMRALGSGGMTNLQVLTSATRMAAEMIGISEDLGTLAPGKLADIVILDANPLDDLRHTTRLNRVMKGGVLYDAETLNQEWPDAQPLPPMWWWSAEPAAANESITPKD